MPSAPCVILYGTLDHRLTAVDGQITGGGETDRFRIKIWDKATGQVVYDNRQGRNCPTTMQEKCSDPLCILLFPIYTFIINILDKSV